jgi:SAM-dependent methyltransferase
VTSAEHNYDLFAETYDRWMAEDFCQRALPVIERLLLTRVAAYGSGFGERTRAGTRTRDLRSNRRDPRSSDDQLCILDLCCGSGQMARALTTRGFRVVGLDSSEPMLRLARKNAPRAEFMQTDMRHFRLPPRFAGALCAFNSLAHLAGVGELKAVFRNVHAALIPGASFLFDLSLEEAYASKWRGSFTLVTDEQACIVRPSYDRKRRVGRNDISLFQARQGSRNGKWTRSNFCIEQKCHSLPVLRGALRAAGFERIDVYDGQRDLDIPGEWGRAFFLCS